MAVLKEIKGNLRAISGIETVTSVYQEIAKLNMNKIRRGVLDNREFIDELSHVYTLIKKEHIVRRLMNKKEVLPKERGRRVVVFLSANERFYGTLILNIWQEILNYLADKEALLAVIGRLGKYFAERSGFGHKMVYFELDDDNPEKEKVKGIIEFIKGYEEIIIFHGRFQTILSQKVAMSKISGQITLEKGVVEAKKYLFEPSPEAVLEFFETELMSAFFNQNILEHRLSKYATRMIAMYRAAQEARGRKRKLKMELKKLERRLFNKKQGELFSGFSLWS
ncbi:MAG: F-type H+-transporting ATPase subunit gamma [Parcubacteria group bacterium Gr01-1014_30]|nr:MAG: F-type H+-transporting ATPase subunit gamma [Parcubacteria group bacterium Gr01-1014_30]